MTGHHQLFLYIASSISRFRIISYKEREKKTFFLLLFTSPIIIILRHFIVYYCLEFKKNLEKRIMMSFQFDHWELDIPHPKFLNAKAKKVTYSKICSVVLIPTIQEFREAGIDLWDTRHDINDKLNEEYFRDSPIPTMEELKVMEEEEADKENQEHQSPKVSDRESKTKVNPKQR